MNGWFQSFGPGMVKINAAWFNRAEGGTFAGIFGFMIQLGQFTINNLASLILAGFTVFTWTVAPNDWHWLFRLPPIFVAMTLYFFESVVIMVAAMVIYSGVVGPTPVGIFLGCFFLVLISLTANSTHAIVGGGCTHGHRRPQDGRVCRRCD